MHQERQTITQESLNGTPFRWQSILSELLATISVFVFLSLKILYQVTVFKVTTPSLKITSHNICLRIRVRVCGEWAKMSNPTDCLCRYIAKAMSVQIQVHHFCWWFVWIWIFIWVNLEFKSDWKLYLERKSSNQTLHCLSFNQHFKHINR